MKIRINKLGLLSLIIILVFIEPPIFTMINSYAHIDVLYNYAKIVCIMGVFIYIVSNSERFKNVLPTIGIITMVWIPQLLSTILYSGNFRSILLSYLTIVSLCAWSQLYIQNNWLSFAKIVSWYLSLLTIINLYMQIRYPLGAYIFQGWRDESYYWLFGNSNSTAPIVIPAIVLSFMVFVQTKKVLYLMFSGLGICSIILCKSSTAFVGMILFFLPVVFMTINLFRNKPLPNPKILNMNTYMAVTLIIAFMLIVLNEFTAFSYIIVDILGKDLTLTSRTSIWARFLAASMEKPIFGHGVRFVSDIRAQFNTSHQHDYYIHLLYQGGFFALVSFINMINSCRKKLTTTHNSKNAFMLSASLLAFLFMFISEVYGDNLHILPFYILIVFSLNVDYLPDSNAD